MVAFWLTEIQLIGRLQSQPQPMRFTPCAISYSLPNTLLQRHWHGIWLKRGFPSIRSWDSIPSCRLLIWMHSVSEFLNVLPTTISLWQISILMLQNASSSWLPHRLAQLSFKVELLTFGPSSYVTSLRLGSTVKVAGVTYWEDGLCDDELAVICGLYCCYTGTFTSWYFIPSNYI